MPKILDKLGYTHKRHCIKEADFYNKIRWKDVSNKWKSYHTADIIESHSHKNVLPIFTHTEKWKKMLDTTDINKFIFLPFKTG